MITLIALWFIYPVDSSKLQSLNEVLLANLGFWGSEMLLYEWISGLKAKRMKVVKEDSSSAGVGASPIKILADISNLYQQPKQHVSADQLLKVYICIWLYMIYFRLCFALCWFVVWICFPGKGNVGEASC